MTVARISQERVPDELTIALDGVARAEWLAANTTAIGRALCKAMALRGSSPVSVDHLLELFITSSDRMYGSEWGARNFMSSEWRELCARGRVAERDGVLVLIAEKNPAPV